MKSAQRGELKDWERCHACGFCYPDVYWADDEQWAQVVGEEAGLLCPECFKRRAWAMGLKPRLTYLAPPLDAPDEVRQTFWNITGDERGAPPPAPNECRSLADVLGEIPVSDGDRPAMDRAAEILRFTATLSTGDSEPTP